MHDQEAELSSANKKSRSLDQVTRPESMLRSRTYQLKQRFDPVHPLKIMLQHHGKDIWNSFTWFLLRDLWPFPQIMLRKGNAEIM